MTDEQKAEAVVDGLQGKFREGDIVYVRDGRYGYRRKGVIGTTPPCDTGQYLVRVHLLADTRMEHGIGYYTAEEMERA